jgi:hypothetical protein
MYPVLGKNSSMPLASRPGERKAKVHARRAYSTQAKVERGECRDASKSIFGQVNDSIAVRINDLAQFLYEAFDREKLTADELNVLHVNYPFIGRLVNKRFIPPPNFQGDHDSYLRRSRLYRKTVPMVDRYSKVGKRPGGDSTFLKFELGINTRGCLHVGSGRLLGSSVPNAAKFVDLLGGEDLFDIDTNKYDMIVSDAAIPTVDGLGQGKFMTLIDWVNDLAAQGKRMIVKVRLDELALFRQPYHILNKSRMHNMEVIVSLNIPGVSHSVTEILDRMVEDNSRRNEAVFNETLPYIEHMDIEFDEDILNSDTRVVHESDIADVTLPFVNRVDQQEKADLDKVRTLMEAGFYIYSNSFNLNNFKNLDTTRAAVQYQLQTFLRKGGNEKNFRYRSRLREYADADLICHPRKGGGFSWLPNGAIRDALGNTSTSNMASEVVTCELLAMGKLQGYRDGIRVNFLKVRKRRDTKMERKE